MAFGVFAVATLSLAATEASPRLDPYRALARSHDAARLFAAARTAMERHWDATPDGPLIATVGWPAAPTAVYVSLVRGRATRACVGRPAPSAATLSEAVAALAVEALDSDPRHPPLRREELDQVRIVIAFGGEPEPIADPMVVDPAREGFSISTERGSIAFLPGEARTVSWALREARRSGVLGGGRASYHRFPVVAVAEPERRTVEETDETP